MAALVRVHPDPELTAVAWDAVVAPSKVSDVLVQRLPHDLVARNVFLLEQDEVIGR